MGASILVLEGPGVWDLNICDLGHAIIMLRERWDPKFLALWPDLLAIVLDLRYGNLIDLIDLGTDPTGGSEAALSRSRPLSRSLLSSLV